MKILQEFKDRWQAETPIFWKKVRLTAIKAGGAAAAVWVANSTMSLGLGITVLAVCKYTITACTAMGLMSQITKTDTNGNA